MNKFEIFDTLVDEVCKECFVKKEDILFDAKDKDTVEARILVVQYLRRIGFSNREIAAIVLKKQSGDDMYTPDKEEIRKKTKSVDKMVKAYSDKCFNNASFCFMSEDIAKFCSRTFDTMYLSWMRPKEV